MAASMDASYCKPTRYCDWANDDDDDFDIDAYKASVAAAAVTATAAEGLYSPACTSDWADDDEEEWDLESYEASFSSDNVKCPTVEDMGPLVREEDMYCLPPRPTTPEPVAAAECAACPPEEGTVHHSQPEVTNCYQPLPAACWWYYNQNEQSGKPAFPGLSCDGWGNYDKNNRINYARNWYNLKSRHRINGGEIWYCSSPLRYGVTLADEEDVPALADEISDFESDLVPTPPDISPTLSKVDSVIAVNGKYMGDSFEDGFEQDAESTFAPLVQLANGATPNWRTITASAGDLAFFMPKEEYHDIADDDLKTLEAQSNSALADQYPITIKANGNENFHKYLEEENDFLSMTLDTRVTVLTDAECELVKGTVLTKQEELNSTSSLFTQAANEKNSQFHDDLQKKIHLSASAPYTPTVVITSANNEDLIMRATSPKTQFKPDEADEELHRRLKTRYLIYLASKETHRRSGSRILQALSAGVGRKTIT
ncbi:hypothetical protein N0V90_003817 [Kalmusia sp. IMI 367209]|nr:hypothetical protein N0V90_003817 [Kalmusia sp. IMI 367209]